LAKRFLNELRFPGMDSGIRNTIITRSHQSRHNREETLVQTKKESDSTKTIRLQQLQDVYRSLVEATDDSIYLVDRQCRYLYVNPRHCSRMNLQLSEMVGRYFQDFHSPQEASIFSRNVEEVFQKGLSFQWEHCSERDGLEYLRTFSPVRSGRSEEDIQSVCIVSKNVTDWKLAENLYSTLAEQSPIGLFIIQDGIYHWSNKRFQENTGFSAKDIIGLDSLSIVHPEDRKHVRSSALAMLRKELTFPYEYRIITKNGDILWYMGTVTPIGYKCKRAVLGSQMDISRQKQAEESLKQSEERSRLIIETIADAYYEVDLKGNLLFFNEAYMKLYGYKHEELLGHNYKQYVDKKNASIVFRAFNQVFKTGNPIKKLEWEIINKKGEHRQVELSVSLIRDAQGRPKGFQGIVADITERHRAEEAIRKQAFSDPLTGLSNRILFYDRLNMAIKKAKRAQKMVAVILLDLDHFKEINDRWGHAAGDSLLKEVAGRLTGLLRESDTAARHGGDEFSVVLPSLNRSDDALQVANRIISVFNKPFHFEHREYTVTSSLGIALFPDSGGDLDTLISKADKAMYQAKTLGRNRYCTYEELKK
jgi:diguanylate cyclase (GGDEF)-like protein/PAS domain S-box-containing protein